MSKILNMTHRWGAMSYEEKGTWVYLVAVAGAYAVYLAVILGRLQGTPVAEVSYGYLGFVFWAIGGSVVKLVAYRRGF
jgi:hypothetical protein